MKRLLNLLILFVLLLSCQEYYTDPNIINGEEILVIEGLITNEPGPYKIKITKSLPYNRTSEQWTNVTPVSNVSVSIADNTGNTEQLTENEPGVYFTSPTGMRGEIGKTYTLDVLTPDGYNYQSEFCLMGMPVTIDSLYAELGEVKTLEKNESGQYIEKIVKGINVYMDAQPAPGHAYYYKVESSAIKETFHYEWRNGRPVPGMRPPVPTPVYCWNTSLLNIEKDLMSNSTNESPVIKKRLVGFISSNVISEPDEINDPTYLIGAINTTTLYSLSKRMYEIYVQLNTQTKPENSIFDPIPTKIESNIACINDPSRIVLGYFNAAAVVKKIYFFNWDNLEVNKEIVDSLPVTPYAEGCESLVPPNFWIKP